MGDGCEEEMVKKDKWTLFEGPDLLRGELWPSCLTFWPDRTMLGKRVSRILHNVQSQATMGLWQE